MYYTGNFFRKGNKSYLHIISINGKTKNETKAINVFTGVDPASSIKQGADYSVIFNVGIDEDENRYALPYYRKRATPLNLAEAIVDNFKKYQSEKTRIESVGYQEMLREYVIKRSKDEGIFIPGLNIKENPRTSKSYRLESLQPLFAKQKVHILEEQLDFIDELLLFPRGKHDDILDGFFYANKGSYTPYHSYEDAMLVTMGKRIINKIDWQTA